MFEPNLDSTPSWVLVTSVTSDPGRHNQNHNCQLALRADALRVKVEIEGNINSWQNAGNLIQFWQPQQENYQVAYQKVFLNRQTIVSVEPLGISRLEFIPVPWLYDWKLSIYAREYIPGEKFINQVINQSQSTGSSKPNIDLGFL